MANLKLKERAVAIESEGQEDDAYWIYLRPGYRVIDGEHAIAEDTRREAWQRLGNVIKCECLTCSRRDVA